MKEQKTPLPAAGAPLPAARGPLPAPAPDNQAPAEKKPDYWYYQSVAVPLFNSEITIPRSARTRGKAVTYSLFATLFLAPMMLPHHGGGEDKSKLERQREFLAQYEDALDSLEKEGAGLPSHTPGRRAQELVDFFIKKDNVPALCKKRQWDYAKRSSSYATPRRYLSFFVWTKQFDADQMAVYREKVERLYSRQLALLFQENPGSLANRLRYLLTTLPRQGEFLLQNPQQATDRQLLEQAGPVLLRALLAAAANRTRDGEVYELLDREFGIPQPVDVVAAGRAARTMVSLPLAAVEELCAWLGAEGVVSEAMLRALLPLLRAVPPRQRARSLAPLQRQMEQRRSDVYGQLGQERSPEKRRQLLAVAAQLESLEAELDSLQADLPQP